jgi:xanthine dehydrogenase YagS FAD-binding subunit
MLMALGATARIIGPQGERMLPIEEFFVLPSEDLLSENVLEQEEMVTEVRLPAPSAGSKSSYRKVRERGAWDFALASVATALTMSGDRVDKARLVLGGVAPRPWRTTAAEREIEGKSLNVNTIRAAAVAATEEAEALEQNAYKIALVQGVVEESLAAF